MREVAEFLREVDIFSTLGEEERRSIASVLSSRSYAAGEALFRQGDPGTEMFILREGTIGIEMETAQGETVEIASLAAGEFLGEMSIFEDAPRSATCRAKEPSLLYALSMEEFSRLMEERPAVAINVMNRMLRIVASRLQRSSAFLSEMVQWGEGAQKRSITDEFTGLFNRRFLDDALETQFSAARERGEPLSVVMIDLDHFNELNEAYGHDVGDEVIKAASEVFKREFSEEDIVARYGGDEFTALLPRTEAEAARERCERVRAAVEGLETLRRRRGTIRAVTTSQGVATYPGDGKSKNALWEAADKALYIAKEKGRNCVIHGGMVERVMRKREIPTIAERNRRYREIIRRMAEGDRFLVTGHANPDADCLASMVAVSLLLRKLAKPVRLVTSGHMSKNIDYLLKIARYNGIVTDTGRRRRGSAARGQGTADSTDGQGDPGTAAPETNGSLADTAIADTVIVCDTAKASLLPEDPELARLLEDPESVIIEVDHHLGGDSRYLREEEIALVDRASSACSLLARLAWKIACSSPREEVFSRNVVVTLLTGMVGDTQFGKVLATGREARVYNLLTTFLDAQLRQKTFSAGNFTDAETLYNEMVRLSSAEKEVWEYLMERQRIDHAVGYVALSPEESTAVFERYGADIVIAVTRSATDRLAEESGRIGLVVYYDERHEESLLQCRMRRNYGYTDVDLRELLDRLSINDGGGHPGAIGFRFPRNRVDDYPALVAEIVAAANQLAEDGS